MDRKWVWSGKPWQAFKTFAIIFSFIMNFVLLLEKRLGLKIPEIDYPKLSSLNGCLSYLKSVDTDSPGGV